MLFTGSLIYGAYKLQTLRFKTGDADLVNDMVQNPLDMFKIVPEAELASNQMNRDFPSVPDAGAYLLNSGFKPWDVNGVQSYFAERTGPDFNLGRFPLARTTNDPILGNQGIYVETIGQGANPAYEQRNLNV